MPVRTCDHLKEDGVYCGSPALKGRNYCYFHLNLRGRRLKAARARRRGHNPALDLPFPEDMHAVQLSLAEIMWALADDRIDTKRAGLLLYMLQQASTNLIRTPAWQGQREAVPATRPLRALTDPNFEQRFGLPPDADLNAELKDDLLTTDNWQLTTDVCHPERECEGAPPLSPDPGDRVGTNDPAHSALKGHGFSPAAEGPLLSSSDNCALTTDNCSPDRVPVPEDELKELQMTKWEEIEFFLYLGRFDRISDQQQQRLKLAWLREKRRFTRAQYLAAQRQGSEEALDPMDGPEYTNTKEPPFGFLNTLAAGDDEAADDAEAA